VKRRGGAGPDVRERAGAVADGAASGYGGPAAALSLSGVRFGYGDDLILEDIDLDVAAGEILVLIGPSGCGKSTVLNLMAGTRTPRSGQVTCHGTPVTGLNRRVSYMTQKDTLLPWRSVLDNAALPLEIKGVPRRERHALARAELARVGVAGVEQHRPHQLSGGMRSRLALARALLSDSPILLLDEPFAAIDALVRVRLQQLLLEVWARTRKTMVYVTHDLNEAITLGHRVAVLGARPGRIALVRAIAAPQPRDVARFRTTPEAQQLYVELWNALEEQVNR
jgi:NitT/TauT family transport system ATP-binding protein